MFCIVIVVGVHVLYCESGKRETSLKSTALRHPNWWTEREQKQDSSPLPHLISGRARRNLMRLPDLK